MQITYDSVGAVQMRFLRLLSENARQDFTYTCINSVAWYDDHARSYKSAINFRGDNEAIFSANKNKPTVTNDGCRVSRTRNSVSFILVFICGLDSKLIIFFLFVFSGGNLNPRPTSAWKLASWPLCPSPTSAPSTTDCRIRHSDSK